MPETVTVLVGLYSNSERWRERNPERFSVHVGSLTEATELLASIDGSGQRWRIDELVELDDGANDPKRREIVETLKPHVWPGGRRVPPSVRWRAMLFDLAAELGELERLDAVDAVKTLGRWADNSGEADSIRTRLAAIRAAAAFDAYDRAGRPNRDALAELFGLAPQRAAKLVADGRPDPVLDELEAVATDA